MDMGRWQVVTVVGANDAPLDVKSQAARSMRLLLADRSRNLQKYPAGEKGGQVRKVVASGVSSAGPQRDHLTGHGMSEAARVTPAPGDAHSR